MSDYKNEYKLIKECDGLKDKLFVFALFINISESTRDLLLRESTNLAYEFEMMLKAYLKVLIESLDPNSPVSKEQFMIKFLNIIKINNISKKLQIDEIISQYENLEQMFSTISYVYAIDSLNSHTFEEKAELVIFLREYISSIIEVMPSFFESSPDMIYVIINFIKDLSISLPSIIGTDKVGNKDFEDRLIKYSASRILENDKNGTFDFLNNLNSKLKETVSALEEKTIPLFKILHAYLIASHGLKQKSVQEMKEFFLSELPLNEKEIFESLKYIFSRLPQNIADSGEVTPKGEMKK